MTDTFTTTIVLNPGMFHYQGSFTGQTFDLATSGTWKGRLFFNFLSPTSGSTNGYTDKLTIQIRAVDFAARLSARTFLARVSRPRSCGAWRSSRYGVANSLSLREG